LSIVTATASERINTATIAAMMAAATNTFVKTRSAHCSVSEISLRGSTNSRMPAINGEISSDRKHQSKKLRPRSLAL